MKADDIYKIKTAVGNVLVEINTLQGYGRLFKAIFGENNEILNKLLSHKEQAVIGFRFGLDGGCVHTLEEAGKKFGVTRERVRQIEAGVIEKIRRAIKIN